MMHKHCFFVLCSIICTPSLSSASESTTPDKEAKPTIGSIGIDYSNKNNFNYGTNIYRISGETITSVGLFGLDIGREYGETMNLGPLVLPSVDRSHLNADGSVRKPKEPWEAINYKFKYGVKVPAKGMIVTAGLGFGGYNGNTLSERGLDYKDIDIFSYGGKLGLDQGEKRYGVEFQREEKDSRIGFARYTTLIDYKTNNIILTGTTPITDHYSWEVDFSYSDKDAFINFDPLVFPMKHQHADLFTIKTGVSTTIFPQTNSVSGGLIINAGQETGSIIACELGGIASNLGGYFSLKNKTGNIWTVSYNHINGKNRQSYLTTDDLTETLDRKIIQAVWKKDLMSIDVSWNRERNTAHIQNAGQWNALLAPFPTGTSPTESTWEREGWKLKGSYDVSSAWILKGEAGWQEISLNQHGLIQPLHEQTLMLGVSYRF